MTALLSTLCWFCDEFEDYGLKKQKYFEPHLFNVATSRAREHTIIIADKYVLDCTTLDMKVRKYLERLKQDKSIYVPDPLSIARQTKQLPEYTKVKGLERDKIKQMALQFIQNAGEEGAKLDAILEYIKDVLPSTKSLEQKRRLLRHILEEMKNENMIQVNGRTWFENGYKS